MSAALTTRAFRRMKAEGKKIVVLTAYDWMLARYLDAAGVDAILVGDSAGQVFAGHRTTLPVTLDDMIYHARAVRRGAPERFLIVNMPFLTFQVSPEETLRNEGRIMTVHSSATAGLYRQHEDCRCARRLSGVPTNRFRAPQDILHSYYLKSVAKTPHSQSED